MFDDKTEELKLHFQEHYTRGHYSVTDNIPINTDNPLGDNSLEKLIAALNNYCSEFSEGRALPKNQLFELKMLVRDSHDGFVTTFPQLIPLNEDTWNSKLQKDYDKLLSFVKLVRDQGCSLVEGINCIPCRAKSLLQDILGNELKDIE